MELQRWLTNTAHAYHVRGNAAVMCPAVAPKLACGLHTQDMCVACAWFAAIVGIKRHMDHRHNDCRQTAASMG
jgi:ribosomal protein S26